MLRFTPRYKSSKPPDASQSMKAVSLETDACDTSLALGLAGAGAGSDRKQQPLALSLSGDGRENRAAAAAAAAASASPTLSAMSSYSAARTPSPEVRREKKFTGGEGRCLDSDGGGKKKLRLTKVQSAMLEDRFKEQSTLDPKQKHALAKQLNLRPRQVEVWFQNRRARTKLKKTEVDYEFLKRCCESLTEENRRLQRELQELKSLKFASPAAAPVYMQFPAATLSVCPSCKAIVAGSNAGEAAEPQLVAPKAQLFGNPFVRSTTC
ncbi:homeobox-leucine zipper protein HOX19-like [Curcuma longa]|uniref:homeobox-leucine zipper protein HOX19-like n=1 Tax=Curcuma longa TaxID=136217 RepID=UPI003D9F3657